MNNMKNFNFTIFISLVLLFTLALSIFFINKATAKEQYEQKEILVKSKISEIKQGLEKITNSKDKPIILQIGELEKTIIDPGFKERMTKIIDDAGLKEEEAEQLVQSLGIEKLEEELSAMDLDIGFMRNIISECLELDNKFSLLQNDTQCSYKKAIDESIFLKNENERLNEKLQNLKTGDIIRPIHQRLAKALELREKSMDLYFQGVYTDLESRITIEVCNDLIDEASGFLSTAKVSRGSDYNLTEKVRRATDSAKEQQEALIKNIEAAEKFYSQASKLMTEYKETMGSSSEQ